MGLGHIAGLGEALAEQPIFFLPEEDTQRGSGLAVSDNFQSVGHRVWPLIRGTPGILSSEIPSPVPALSQRAVRKGSRALRPQPPTPNPSLQVRTLRPGESREGLPGHPGSWRPSLAQVPGPGLPARR